MNRMHIHISVKQLTDSIKFYSTLFNTAPTFEREDYAKWVLDDPSINFAISNRGQQVGLNHLGIQVDSNEALDEIAQRLQVAEIDGSPQEGVSCCYANSNKYWALDPEGIAWESFHTLSESSSLACGTNSDASDTTAACCIPLHQDHSQQQSSADKASCCLPIDNLSSNCCN